VNRLGATETAANIPIVKGVEELVANFEESNPAAGYLGIVIALCFWFSVFILEYMGSTRLFRAPVRKVLSDYAYPVSITTSQPAWHTY
jgi:hypothetical protein